MLNEQLHGELLPFTRLARLCLAHRPSGSLDVLADMGGDENLFQMGHFLVGAGANEVDTALKQLSSSGSLIRNVRLNG
jgi:hypothetical protein